MLYLDLSILKYLAFRKDRVTIQERERLEEETTVTEEKQKKLMEDRKRQSTKVSSWFSRVECFYGNRF